VDPKWEMENAVFFNILAQMARGETQFKISIVIMRKTSVKNWCICQS
jgi:hypothetical protein